MESADRIAVVGLWHLGCSITVGWLRLGKRIAAIEFNSDVLAGLRQGHAPLFEPDVDAALAEGLARGALTAGDDPGAVRGCGVVFIAYDTPVRDDDTADVAPIWAAVEACGPKLDRGAVVVISAQLPVGTSRRIRARLKEFDPSLEVVYSPENLRLGEAVRCYLEPGHVVIGADDDAAGARIEALFAPMNARAFRMNLPSAEMTKHGINSFLATSVTLANQWADICAATGADYGDVSAAMRADPRIGQRAYITPGIGFSGGTLGRDLRVLDETSTVVLAGEAPLFGQIWAYNMRRVEVVARRASAMLGGCQGRRIALLGMTYKPGTSTLRRSLPLAVAKDLLASGAGVVAHDPKADWREVTLPEGFVVAQSPYEACEGADLAVLLTEWPEYRELDFARLAAVLRRPLVFDTKDFLRPRAQEMAAAGLQRIGLGSAPAQARP